MHTIAIDESRGHARVAALHQPRADRDHKIHAISERGFPAARRSRSSDPQSIHTDRFLGIFSSFRLALRSDVGRPLSFSRLCTCNCLLKNVKRISWNPSSFLDDLESDLHRLRSTCSRNAVERALVSRIMFTSHRATRCARYSAIFRPELSTSFHSVSFSLTFYSCRVNPCNVAELRKPAISGSRSSGPPVQRLRVTRIVQMTEVGRRRVGYRA